jgi:hypothetical protein
MIPGTSEKENETVSIINMDIFWSVSYYKYGNLTD